MIRANDFPLLRDFVRGYLHQDLIPEHGSPKAAAQAYVAALAPEERMRLRQETTRLLESFRNVPIERVNHQLSAMGSAWTFNSASEVHEVLHTFESAV